MTHALLCHEQGTAQQGLLLALLLKEALLLAMLLQRLQALLRVARPLDPRERLVRSVEELPEPEQRVGLGQQLRSEGRLERGEGVLLAGLGEGLLALPREGALRALARSVEVVLTRLFRGLLLRRRIRPRGRRPHVLAWRLVGHHPHPHVLVGSLLNRPRRRKQAPKTLPQ